MRVKRSAATCLGVAALAAGAFSSPASAEPSGSVPVNGPGGCDVVVWWNSGGNPIAGATVPNPTYCTGVIWQLLGTDPWH